VSDEVHAEQVEVGDDQDRPHRTCNPQVIGFSIPNTVICVA